MKYLLIPILAAALFVGGVFAFFEHARQPAKEFYTSGAPATQLEEVKKEMSVEERVKLTHDRSAEIKGVYMTAGVASANGVAATRLRNSIIDIVDTTEINGIVIDVKEVCGPEYNEVQLKKLLGELHQKNIWAIARIVTFKDASEIDAHPEWYLKRASPLAATRDECAGQRYLRAKSADGQLSDAIFWRDRRGGYWLDAANPGARQYIISIGKKMIDLGFDELQFDYVRFPSDGDVEKAIYPSWDKKTPKDIVMRSFFEFLNRELKGYKPEIILSADLFGYVAIRAGDVGIGQRLDDIGDNFDYISFMVYPSHYQSGLVLPADPSRGLPTVNYNAAQARMHPDVTVGRSLQTARDFLDGRTATSTTATATSATSSPVHVAVNPTSRSHARLRPWLEDFYHEADAVAGRPYGVEKIQLQIQGTEAVEKHGWLLWNAGNVYTVDALKKEY